MLNENMHMTVNVEIVDDSSMLFLRNNCLFARIICMINLYWWLWTLVDNLVDDRLKEVILPISNLQKWSPKFIGFSPILYLSMVDILDDFGFEIY